MRRNDTEILADSLELPCGLVLKNRIAKAALCDGLAGSDNLANEKHAVLYGQWGEGEVGLLVTGNVLLDRWHLERPGNIAIVGEQSNHALAMLADMAAASKKNGAAVIMQLNHAGRQTQKIINKTPKGPSDVGLKMGNGRFGKPTAMTKAEVEEIIERHVYAAKVAQDTGFDGIQIHMAHGYLGSQFLSGLSNRRNDEYGGDLAGRAKFLLDIVDRVRAVVKSGFAITVKLNSSDFQKGGFTARDSATVAKWLQDAGVDMIELSGGNYEQPRMIDFDRKDPLMDLKKRESTRRREAYFLEFVPLMRESVTVPIMVTGGFRTVSAMARSIEEDGVDIVGLGRPFCIDTTIADKLLSGEVTEIRDYTEDTRVGRGLLGPASPISFLRDLNAWSELFWFYAQMDRLAEEQEPDLDMSGFKALMMIDKAEAKAAKALVR